MPAPTAKMQLCGGLTIALKLLTPYIPRFEIEKVNNEDSQLKKESDVLQEKVLNEQSSNLNLGAKQESLQPQEAAINNLQDPAVQ